MPLQDKIEATINRPKSRRRVPLYICSPLSIRVLENL